MTKVLVLVGPSVATNILGTFGVRPSNQRANNPTPAPLRVSTRRRSHALRGRAVQSFEGIITAQQTATVRKKTEPTAQTSSWTFSAARTVVVTRASTADSAKEPANSPTRFRRLNAGRTVS